MPRVLFSFICVVVLAVLTSLVHAQVQATGLSAGDAARIKAVNEAYGSAWLANDSAAVMQTLTPDAVLIPPGAHAIQGSHAIKKFWWPGVSKTTVTAFTMTMAEIGGEKNVAIVRGTFRLSFVYQTGGNKLERTNDGNYLMILKRQADNTWRISHRMWGDLPQRR